MTRDGEQVLFDLEGIAVDTSIAHPTKDAGFWLASEGNASTTRNTLIQVDGSGEILREIFLPPEIHAPGGRITSNGFEGVTVSAMAAICSSRSSVPTVGKRSPTPGCRFSTSALRGTISSSGSGRHSFIR